MEKEYLIVGSDNFWYASCLKTLKEVERKVYEIENNLQSFENPENGETAKLPETLYVYKTEEIKRVSLKAEV